MAVQFSTLLYLPAFLLVLWGCMLSAVTVWDLYFQGILSVIKTV